MSVKSLTELPVEILNQIFVETPNELKQTCKLFYVMSNDCYYQLFLKDFGQGIIEALVKHDYVSIINYIEGLDYWRGPLRKIVSDYYELEPPKMVSDPYERLQFQFIKDSWKLIYYIYKNHRVSLSGDDFGFTDDPTRVFSKKIYLSPGVYNFAAALQIAHDNKAPISGGFSVINKLNNSVLCEYVFPTHLKDLIFDNKFFMLNMGDFEVKESTISDKSIPDHLRTTLIPIEIKVNAIMKHGLSNLTLYYLDINAYNLNQLALENGKLLPNYKLNPNWFAWWINQQIPTTDNIKNILLERVYASIEVSEEQLHSSQNVICLDKMPPNSLTLGGRTINCNDYNREFYKRINEQGNEITREIKWMTMKDRRFYEELIANHHVNPELLVDTPSKFKLHPIIDLA